MQKTAIEKLSEYLVGQGLRSTSQRDSILKIFVEAGKHLSAEELYVRVKKSHPSIGYATVYRTLKLLAGAGLAEERHFEDGFNRYEYRATDGHHDHLICLDCGKIIEFEDPTLEALQNGIAQRYRFRISHHLMELYGQCEECRQKGRTGGRRS